MNLNLSIPTISHLQKVPRDQVYRFANDLIQAWHEGQLVSGINRMCEATHRNPVVEMDLFKDPREKKSEACICRGFRKNVKGGGRVKCHRKAREGTNYCGYHQGQANQGRIQLPPKRVPLPPQDMVPKPSSSVVAPEIEVAPPPMELMLD